MNRIGRLRTLRATHRFSALLLALVWSAGPLLAALHADGEWHRYCPEHGTLEEAATPTPDDADESGAGARVAGDGAASAEHDACAFAACARFGQQLARLILADLGDIDAQPIAPPPCREPPRRLAVITVAPKTSPPA